MTGVFEKKVINTSKNLYIVFIFKDKTFSYSSLIKRNGENNFFNFTFKQE